MLQICKALITLAGPHLLRADAVEGAECADENLATADGGRRVTFLAEIIPGNHLELRAGFEHKHLAVIIEEIKVSACGNRRCTVMAAEFFLPHPLAGLRLKTSG